MSPGRNAVQAFCAEDAHSAQHTLYGEGEHDGFTMAMVQGPVSKPRESTEICSLPTHHLNTKALRHPCKTC